MSDIPMEDYKVEAYGTVVNPPEAEDEDDEKGDEE